MLARHETNQAFRRVMRGEVDRAEALLRRGRPLAGMVTPALRREVQLFVDGGLAVLAGIRQADFDVWRQRPRVSRLAKLRLVLRSAWAPPWLPQSGDLS
jgi:phytoene/squalene synthetase